MIKRILTSATTLATAAVLATGLALAAVGNQNPNLTVQLTLDPTAVTPPAQVTLDAAVTNNTRRTDRVTAELEVTAPDGQTTSYYQNLKLAAGQTATYSVTYDVPVGTAAGVYTVTLSATDKNGTSQATEYVSVL